MVIIKGILLLLFCSRMYQFIGDATGTDGLDFQPLFAEYENNPGKRQVYAHLTIPPVVLAQKCCQNTRLCPVVLFVSVKSKMITLSWGIVLGICLLILKSLNGSVFWVLQN